jgi:hypothetical protein
MAPPSFWRQSACETVKRWIDRSKLNEENPMNLHCEWCGLSGVTQSDFSDAVCVC